MATHRHPRGFAVAPHRCGPRCGIVPPYLLARVAEQAGADIPSALRLDEQFRANRASLLEDASARRARPSARPGTDAATPAGPDRLVSDAQGTETLPGEPVRGEQDAPTGDPAVDETYDGLGSTYALFAEAFGRAGIDGADAPQLATVHYGQNYANAFWGGTQMVLGDGDGRVFRRFSLALDVIGHELSHGVIEHTAQLVYRGQSGALNESIADVFGALTQQHAQGITATEADWLIGEGLFTDTVQGQALRSMSEPGTAYDDPALGTDPQPGHMDDYSDTEEDYGGVHINSGIPNRAFYLAATEIGGNAWEAAGQVWYAVLTGDQIQPDCDFATFAELTLAEAKHAFGADSTQARAVSRAWQEVGVTTARSAPVTSPETEPVVQPEPGESAPTELTIRVVRSGGLLGRSIECVVELDSMTEADAGAWWQALHSDALLQAARARPRPDAFVYRISAPDADVDVAADEQELPADLKQMLDRALGT